MMTDHPSIFDAVPVDDATAQEARRAAIATSEGNASLRWLDAAYGAVCLCARTFPRFSADEVWETLALAKRDAIETERNPAALGAVFLRAARDGVIEKVGILLGERFVGETVRSRFARRHRDLQLWRAVDRDDALTSGFPVPAWLLASPSED
jgi:hypothetical protein